MLKEYVMSSVSITLFSSIMLSLSHKKNNKTAACCVGIIIISAIMLPFVDVIGGIDISGDFEFGTDSSIDMSGEEVLKASFEEGISRYVAEHYSTPIESVKVNIDGFDAEYMQADSIYITLDGKGMLLDYRRIEDDVAEQFTNGGRCEVELNVG